MVVRDDDMIVYDGNIPYTKSNYTYITVKNGTQSLEKLASPMATVLVITNTTRVDLQHINLDAFPKLVHLVLFRCGVSWRGDVQFARSLEFFDLKECSNLDNNDTTIDLYTFPPNIVYIRMHMDGGGTPFSITQLFDGTKILAKRLRMLDIVPSDIDITHNNMLHIGVDRLPESHRRYACRTLIQYPTRVKDVNITSPIEYYAQELADHEWQYDGNEGVVNPICGARSDQMICNEEESIVYNLTLATNATISGYTDSDTAAEYGASMLPSLSFMRSHSDYYLHTLDDMDRSILNMYTEETNAEMMAVFNSFVVSGVPTGFANLSRDQIVNYNLIMNSDEDVVVTPQIANCVHRVVRDELDMIIHHAPVTDANMVLFIGSSLTESGAYVNAKYLAPYYITSPGKYPVEHSVIKIEAGYRCIVAPIASDSPSDAYTILLPRRNDLRVHDRRGYTKTDADGVERVVYIVSTYET